MSNLPIIWTADIKDATKKKKFEEHIRNSVHSAAWDKLKDIVDKRRDSTFNTQLKLEEYDNPAWAYKQAYNNGYVAALKFVYDLINIEKE